LLSSIGRGIVKSDETFTKSFKFFNHTLFVFT
jgi:hypothetical protein